MERPVTYMLICCAWQQSLFQDVVVNPVALMVRTCLDELFGQEFLDLEQELERLSLLFEP